MTDAVVDPRTTPAPSIRPAIALLLMPVSFALLVATGFALDWGVPGLILMQVVGFALPAWIAARRAGPPARVLALVRPPRRALVGAALVATTYWYVSAAILLPLVSDLVTRDEAELLTSQFAGPEPLALKLLAFAAVPALCEEMLFRGAMARGLSPRLRLSGAAIVSALYFALLHGSLARLPITFALGIVLAIAVIRSGSLVPAVLIHAGNNTAALLLTWPPLAGVAVFLGEAAPMALPIAVLGTVTGMSLLWRAGRDRTSLVSDATSL